MATRVPANAESNEITNSFIANISHDIRTPLHTILGTAELLQIKPHLPEQKQHFDAITQAGDTLLKFIENILEFSTLEKNRLELNEEVIDLLSLIQKAVATITTQAYEKGIEIIVNYDERLPDKLLSNADAISRIVLNLLSNAIKFTHAGQIIISITCLRDTPHALLLNISVKDTGIGIAQHELKYIFDRFYRITPSYKGKYKGTGLGLAITKKLVTKLNGDIQVDSTPDIGSQFVCTLPVKKIQKEKGRLQKRNQKLSILLVEDVPLIQKFSMDILKTLGCEVTVANNAAEAIKYSEKYFDLIFMDIGLPDEDGLSVIRKLRKNHQHQQTPIIALTAHANDKMRQDCYDAGVNDFLAKPASYRTLLNCINKFN